MADFPNSDRKSRLAYLLPIFLYCLLIFIQSSLPSPRGGPNIGPVDKLIHILMYMILGALILRAFLGLGKTSNRHRVLLWSIALSALYGLSDEIHQSFVNARSADPLDLLADLTGSFIGVFFYHIFIAGYQNSIQRIPGLTKIDGFIKQDRIESLFEKAGISRLRRILY